MDGRRRDNDKSTHSKLRGTFGIQPTDSLVEASSATIYIQSKDGKFNEFSSVLIEQGFTGNLDEVKRKVNTKAYQLNQAILAIENPSHLKEPKAPILKGSDPEEPSPTRRVDRHYGKNYDAMSPDELNDTGYDEYPNPDYQQELQDYQLKRQEREIVKTEHQLAMLEYQKELREYNKSKEAHLKKNKKELKQQKEEYEAVKGLSRQLRNAVSIPTYQKVFEDFHNKFTDKNNPHLINIRAELGKINGDNDKENIKDFINVIIKEYENITNSALYPMIGDDKLAQELQKYCKEQYEVVLPDKLENPLDIKYGQRYALMVNEPAPDNAYTFPPTQQELKDFLKKIVDSINKNDWRSQTTLGFSRPDGIEKIVKILNDKSNISFEDKLSRIQKKCAKRLEDSKFSRSDITRDFYKSLASINLNDKYSLVRVSEAITSIDARLEAQNAQIATKESGLRYHGTKR